MRNHRLGLLNLLAVLSTVWASSGETTFSQEVIYPPRITATHFEDTGPLPRYPPAPNTFRFIMEYPKETVVSLEHRSYRATYPHMEPYTLFPVLGKLYCFDQLVVDHKGRHCVSAFQLDDNEVPQDLKRTKNALICPSITPRFSNQMISGEGGGVGYILVGPIQQEGQGKDTRPTARILTADRDHQWMSTQVDNKSLWYHWPAVHVGDVVKFGASNVRCRVSNIVPPDSKGYTVRGHLCKMIGWIELKKESPSQN